MVTVWPLAAKARAFWGSLVEIGGWWFQVIRFLSQGFLSLNPRLGGEKTHEFLCLQPISVMIVTPSLRNYPGNWKEIAFQSFSIWTPRCRFRFVVLAAKRQPHSQESLASMHVSCKGFLWLPCTGIHDKILRST